MNCLLVVAHPINDSLCKTLCSHVEHELIQLGHEVVVEDLYAGNFNPLLSEKERETYYSESYDSSGIQEQVERLVDAEALVLLFPTWWFGFPAILKGWFDRVWGPGVAYEHANDYGPIKPKLENLEQVLAITSMGSPWWVDRLVMWQPVKRILKLALMGACAKGSKLQFLTLYNSEKLYEKQISAFKGRIDKALNLW
jgi:putative NADPH-quinone reductase